MKKLSLLMFAIMILGCGTEKPVVEEPVIEEPEPVIEEPPPVVMEEEPIPAPQIVGGNVLDGAVDVDPEPLNRNGIVFQFQTNLNMYIADLRGVNVGALNWSPRDVVERWEIDIKNQIHLMPMADSKLLEYDTEYEVTIYAQDLACNGAWKLIKFRTKPR